MNFTIHRVPAFQDNYLWVIANASGDAIVVDPGDAEPIIECLDSNQLKLTGILATHHHGDHIGGIDALLSKYHCPVYGPCSSNIPQVTHPLREGDSVEILGAIFSVMEVPGHTLDHIVYFSLDIADIPVLFAGDTLFAGGCGRLFEGTPAQMYASLTKIATLPPNTGVYCAHEYTLSNLRFAVAVEPENGTIRERFEKVGRLRAENLATVPTTLAVEISTNPFLRSNVAAVVDAAGTRLGRQPQSPVETFATIRGWKDSF